MLAALIDIDVPGQECLEFLAGKARPRPTAWSGGRSRVQPSGCLVLRERLESSATVRKGHSLSVTPCLPTALGCSPDLTRFSKKWDDCCSKVEGMADDEISNSRPSETG